MDGNKNTHARRKIARVILLNLQSNLGHMDKLKII